MKLKHKSKRQNTSICVLSLLVISAAFIFAALSTAHAAGPIALTVIGPDGSSYPINDITTMTPTVGWGGYYNKAGSLFPGDFQGVSLLALCDSIGTSLASYQNVTVTTSGGSGTNITFDYDQVANGINIAPQYSTYNNVTGSLQSPTAPVTLIVAYQYLNGSALPGTGTTRLFIVGSEGLLFQGTGLAGVTTITITNVGPVPTPTPLPLLHPRPSLYQHPLPLLPHCLHKPQHLHLQQLQPRLHHPLPAPTISASPSPAPTVSSTTTPTSTPTSKSNNTQIVIESLGIVAVIIVIVAVVVILVRRRK